MNHPDDIRAFLKGKLEDRNPKCGNCKHWERFAAYKATEAVGASDRTFWIE